MGTYTIQIPGGQLSDERKAALPEAVKDAHAKTTGAPRDLTQATVLEISSACFWLHGTPLECHQIFVHGFVAADAGHSRGPALRDAVASAVASAADFELGSVLVTISEVAPDRMKPAGALASEARDGSAQGRERPATREAGGRADQTERGDDNEITDYHWKSSRGD
jgi:phenylpyruvate tautomerase PptA (4-oxalocrotonate tautomerase family)